MNFEQGTRNVDLRSLSQNNKICGMNANKFSKNEQINDQHQKNQRNLREMETGKISKNRSTLVREVN